VDLGDQIVATSGNVGDGMRTWDAHGTAELAVLFESSRNNLCVLPVRSPAEGDLWLVWRDTVKKLSGVVVFGKV
jgi:hypothetical protein